MGLRVRRPPDLESTASTPPTRNLINPANYSATLQDGSGDVDIDEFIGGNVRVWELRIW